MHLPPAPAQDLNANFAGLARSLYTQFHTIVDKHKRTAALADEIFKNVKSSNRHISIFNPCPFSLPFKISALTQSVDNLHGFFCNAPSRVTYIALVFKRNFRLYLRQRTKETQSFDIYETTKDSFINVLPASISSKLMSGLRRGYIIFISHHMLHKFGGPIPPPNPDEPQEYYNYKPLLQDSIDSRKAPFHHEIQLEKFCAMHALNSYIGCRYYNLEKIQGKRIERIEPVTNGSPFHFISLFSENSMIAPRTSLTRSAERLTAFETAG